jgi:NADH-quinone oxidoreductase subunit J
MDSRRGRPGHFSFAARQGSAAADRTEPITRMALTAIAFYLLAVVSTVAALLVVSARNPVHSVLFLILCFFSAAGLFVLLGAEFLAMLLVVVYVGAVAVLFLFVVMMLDVDFAQLRKGFAAYLPAGLVVAAVLLVEIILVSATVADRGEAAHSSPHVAGGVRHSEALGRVLYTDYFYFFQAAGIVLLIAMIGAIVLTLKHRPHVKRQNIARQVARNRASGMEVVTIESGKGIAE